MTITFRSEVDPGEPGPTIVCPPRRDATVFYIRPRLDGGAGRR